MNSKTMSTLALMLLFVAGTAAAQPGQGQGRGDEHGQGHRPGSSLFWLSGRLERETDDLLRAVMRERPRVSSAERDAVEAVRELGREARDFQVAVRRGQGRVDETRRAYDALYSDYRRALSRFGVLRPGYSTRAAMDQVTSTMTSIAGIYQGGGSSFDLRRMRDAAHHLDMHAGEAYQRARAETPSWSLGPDEKRRGVSRLEDFANRAARLHRELDRGPMNRRELERALDELEEDYERARNRINLFSPAVRREFSEAGEELRRIKWLAHD